MCIGEATPCGARCSITATRPPVVSLEAFMVASAPKNQKASPSSFPTAIGVSDGLAASDITHQLLDWWLVPRLIRLEQMPNPPDESENKKRISVERQGRGSRQNLLAPKYSCRSDGEKNRTNNACHANPNGEFLGDTCEHPIPTPRPIANPARKGAWQCLKPRR